MKKTSYMILTDAAVSKARENLCEAIQILDDYNSEHKSYVTGKIKDEIIRAVRLLYKVEGIITEYGKNFSDKQA